MNDFEDTADWEKLVALSDEELEAAIAKQSKPKQDIHKQANSVQSSDFLNDKEPVTFDFGAELASPPPSENLLKQDEESDLGWNYLLEQESTPSSEAAEYAKWEQENSPEITAHVSDLIPDWEIPTELPIEINNSDDGWETASDEVNTEFMKGWDLENNPPAQVEPMTQGWETASDDVNTEFMKSWELENNPPAQVEPLTQGWEAATDDVNTEFMKEWEQSAARISELTGIDLSQEREDVSGNLEKSKPSSVPAPSKPSKLDLPTESDLSGPLPPLPVLPPKKAHIKKQTPVNKSSDTDSDWFEKYHDESLAQENPPKLVEPKPTYHFDDLAEEICDNDQFSWTNLNQSIQSQPQPKSAPVWTPSEKVSDKILVDLDEDEIESTAVWNYNPPESYTESETQFTENKTKSTFDLQPIFKQISEIQLWKRLKLPILAIACVGGLFAIYSVPFVNRAITEMALKSQFFKDASEKNLSGMNFEAAKLERVNFSKAILSNTNFKKANLNGANLNGANLKGADFTGANLRAADLRDSEIELEGEEPTKFENKDLLMWRIVNVPLAGRNLSKQNLDGFNLNSAMLKKANFTDAKLNWVNFSNADLSGAQLVGANLTGINFSGANLSGADLYASSWSKHEPRSNESTICPNGKKGPCKF